jgi:single-strand DNA-binding protein
LYNKVILVGRLTQSPELKYTNTGVPVAKYGLAVNRNFKNAQGVYETDFFNIVAWRKVAEISAKFLKKGRLVLIEGRLQSRKYQAQDGSSRTAFEIQADQMQMLEPKGKGGESESLSAPHYTKEASGSSPVSDTSSDMDFSDKENDFGKMNQDDIDFEDVPF